MVQQSSNLLKKMRRRVDYLPRKERNERKSESQGFRSFRFFRGRFSEAGGRQITAGGVTHRTRLQIANKAGGRHINTRE